MSNVVPLKSLGKARGPSALPQKRRLPTHREIAKRAFEIYLARGGSHGRDVEDWLQAEAELGSGASSL